MAQLTRHSGHLPILSNNHMLWSSHHWIYPLSVSCVFYTSCMFFITCFTAFGRAMYCNFCSNLPWFNKVFYLSWKSNQFTNRSPLLYARAYATRTWPQKTGHKKPFETLDCPIGNPLSQCRNLGFRTSSILHPVSGDLQLYFAPSRLQKVSSLRLHLSNGSQFTGLMQFFDLKTMWYPLTSTSICSTASTNVLFISILLRSIRHSQFLSNSFP